MLHVKRVNEKSFDGIQIEMHEVARHLSMESIRVSLLKHLYASLSARTSA